MPAVRIAAFIFLVSLLGPLQAVERAGDPAPTASQRALQAESAKQDKAKPSESPKRNGAKPAEPTLDLEALEKRLKETEAIGLFTKLTLKNEVDDLLERFRAHYEGRGEATPAELRQPYELLILKVLTLLQDGDPALARTIADSREAIWSILTDRGKFTRL